MESIRALWLLHGVIDEWVSSPLQNALSTPHLPFWQLHLPFLYFLVSHGCLFFILFLKLSIHLSLLKNLCFAFWNFFKIYQLHNIFQRCITLQLAWEKYQPVKWILKCEDLTIWPWLSSLLNKFWIFDVTYSFFLLCLKCLLLIVPITYITVLCYSGALVKCLCALWITFC